MRKPVPAIAMMAFVGYCSQASAQAPCPELARLRSEAVQVSIPASNLPPEEMRRRSLMPDRCETYIRSSIAWGATVQYAKENRESCDISIRLLSELEKYHREAVSARDNVCAGRPVRPFPPDIIRH